MTVKFYGHHEIFVEIIYQISRHVNWRDPSDTMVQVELDGGVVVTYFWETGSVMFQGPSRAAGMMRRRFLKGAGRLVTA